MIIKDWLYAIAVCRKYKIWWNPFFKLTHAEFQMSYKRLYKEAKCVIRINPLYKGFIDSFMHEVGHIVRHRSIYMKVNDVYDYECAVSDVLREEYKAWQFSKLALKNRFNKNRARRKFKTYFPRYAKEVGTLKAVDRYYKYDRRIEK